jgi:hypothetical protein
VDRFFRRLLLFIFPTFPFGKSHILTVLGDFLSIVATDIRRIVFARIEIFVLSLLV